MPKCTWLQAQESLSVALFILLDETGCPTHPTSSHIAGYFRSYATHFGLHQRIRLNTSVEKVIRNPSDTARDVHVTNLQRVRGGYCPYADAVLFKPRPIPGKEGPCRRHRELSMRSILSLARAAKVYQSYRRGRIAFDTFFTWSDTRLKCQVPSRRRHATTDGLFARPQSPDPNVRAFLVR